jgi:hypothetical protein
LDAEKLFERRTSMTADIRSILSRLTAVESRITPAAPKIKGLNPQQKSADQLPALFRPRSVKALGSNTDPAHPMRSKAVGANESRLAETMQAVEEDMLSKVKRDFVDYLERLEDKVRTDPDLKHKAKREIRQELEAAAEEATEEAMAAPPPVTAPPTTSTPPVTATTTTTPPTPTSLPPVIERPIKTCAMEDGAVFEIYGDEGRGFEVRNRGRVLPTRFDRLDDADIAVKLFQKRRATRNTNQDYIDEV